MCCTGRGLSVVSVVCCTGRGLSVVSVVCCTGRGFCDELITHPEESYRLWCDLETS